MKVQAHILGAAAVVIVALGSGVFATSASAMNGAEFAKACAKKSNCVPAGGNDGGYFVHPDGSFTVVVCDKSGCTVPKDRKAKPDKTLGQGNLPGQGQVAPTNQTGNNDGRRPPILNSSARERVQDHRTAPPHRGGPLNGPRPR